LNARHLYRIGLVLSLILALGLFLAQSVVRFDPYRLAQRPMAWTLNRNPGLPDRLVLYSGEADAWRETFRLGVDFAVGILTVVERLETLGWWEGLLAWIDRIPGALEFFESIVDLARDFVALDVALGELAEAAWVAEPLTSIQARAWLDREQLARVDAGIGDILVVMTAVHERLDRVAERIRKVDRMVETADLLLKLEEAHQSNPLLPKKLVDRLEGAVATWRALADDFDRVSGQIRSDRKALEGIRLWYARAERVDRALTTSVVWEIATWIEARTTWGLTGLALALTMAVVGRMKADRTGALGGSSQEA
jgi:hypothetical protein